MIKKGVVGMIVLFIFLLAGCQKSPLGGEETDQAFSKIPQVVLQDYQGNEVALREFIGKPLVINSWAMWCPFCRNELVDFARLQKKFERDIVVIAVNRQEPLKDIKEFTDSLDIADTVIFLLDPDDDFYRAIGGFSMPETIFIDRKGNIVFHKRGPLTFEEMQQKVEQML